MKIVVLDAYTNCPEDREYKALHTMGDVTVYDRTPFELAAGRIGDAEAILTNKVPVNEELLLKCPNIRYIGVLATGYNIIDMAACKRRGITVCSIPAYSTRAVAQHVFALLLHEASRVAAYDARIRKGDWLTSPDFCFFDGSSEELAGQTLGVFGCGAIGQAVIRIALAFGMKVLVTTGHPEGKALPEGAAFVPKETLLRESDVLTLHCPLTPETDRLLNETTLSMVKPGIRIINTARGGIVDSAAMAEALKSGRVGAYLADVMEKEPPRADDPLLTAPNTVLTPHIAWAPRQTRERLLSIAIANFKAYEAGKPQNVVSR